MPFLTLKFLHVGSMFLATALAIGPSILLYLVARTGDVEAIRRAFGAATQVFRAAGALYGLGLLFGFLAAWNGQLDLTASWLVTAYVLVAMLLVINLGFERWARRVEEAVAVDVPGPADVAAATASRAAIAALVGMIVITVSIVFVMVVKPTLF